MTGGNFNIAHFGIPHLIKTKGYIVVVSSLGGQFRGPGMTAYCTGKHTLNRFVEQIQVGQFTAFLLMLKPS